MKGMLFAMASVMTLSCALFADDQEGFSGDNATESTQEAADFSAPSSDRDS